MRLSKALRSEFWWIVWSELPCLVPLDMADVAAPLLCLGRSDPLEICVAAAAPPNPEGFLQITVRLLSGRGGVESRVLVDVAEVLRLQFGSPRSDLDTALGVRCSGYIDMGSVVFQEPICAVAELEEWKLSTVGLILNAFVHSSLYSNFFFLLGRDSS